MSIEPFLGELMIHPWPNRTPKGWAPANGQFLPINQNQALFSLLGTTFGGNGQTTFALPNLQGRVPVHRTDSNAFTLGQAGGTSSVTLSISQLPTHTHFPSARTQTGDTGTPSNSVSLAPAVAIQQDSSQVAVNLFSTGTPLDVALAPAAISNVGGSQPHNNMMPYLTLGFVIALQGVFPSPN